METPETSAVPVAQTTTSDGPFFDVGSVLSRSFSTLMKNPLLFFGLTLAASLPTFIVEAFSPDQGGLGIVMNVVQTILGLVVEGAIAYAVYRVLTGKNASLGYSVSRGMGRIIPLFLAALVTGLGIGIGLVLLVIPGLIVMCVWVVTIPACVVEKLGPLESIRRSADLTRGFRLPIFGLLLITGVLVIAVGAGIGFIVGAVSGGNVVAAVLIAGVGTAAVQAFNCVMVAIIYYDLRAIKEGVTLDSLSSIFD